MKRFLAIALMLILAMTCLAEGTGRELSGYFGKDITDAAAELGGLTYSGGTEFKDNYVSDALALRGIPSECETASSFYDAMEIRVALALLQQHLGLIKMPGAWPGTAYPVVLKAGDVLLIAAGVALVGYLIALLAAGRLHKADKK